MGKKQLKTHVTKSFKSEADFDNFVKGERVLFYKAEKTGPLIQLSSLDELIAASKVAGRSFFLEDPVAQMRADVSNLKSHRANTSNGFGDIANKAIAINPTLLSTYGGKLDALNGGRGVVFYSAEDDSAFVECDGLVRNSAFVLLNEAKTHFHESDATSLAGKGKGTLSSCEKLGRVISYPGQFYSDPPGIIEQLAGLSVVPIASSPRFSEEASKACAALGIHTLSQDGSGFAVTLHMQPACS